MQRLISLLLSVLALVAAFQLSGNLHAQAPALTGESTKTGSGNPSLGITAFDGPDAARQLLEGVLKRCDWFAVVEAGKAKQATVQLKGAWQDVPVSAFILDVAVPGKAPVRIVGSGDTAEKAAGKAVDGVLKALFNVPGLCNCPVVYALHDEKNLKELYSLTLAGGKPKRLTNNNAISTEPAWGHAGALVYTVIANNSISVVLMDMAQRRQRIVSKSKGLNSSAALSRSGRYLALPLSVGKQVDLYLIDLKDMSRRRLTNDRSVESSPVFSPDGQRLCYVSDKSGRPQLYIMTLADGKSMRLQLGGGECVSPDWSAVSNKLCFAQRVATGRYAIAVLDLNVADASPVVVTEAAGNWEAPTWAPDGRHIACSRQSGGSQDLYMVDTWFNHSFRRLTGGSKISLPAWSPAR